MSQANAPKTILIVDDNEATNDMMQELLRTHGLRPLSAFDAVQGVIMARRDRPDLIILDFEMPGGSGATMYTSLRKFPETFQTPIIFVTGSIKVEELRQIIRMDSRTRYLPKPIKFNDLLRLMDQMISPESQERAQEPGETLDLD